MKNNVTIYKTRPRQQVVDLDHLPFPDRSLVDYEKYNRELGMAMVKNGIAFQVTRGCPYHCAYCHKIWPKRHVFRSAENILSEIRPLYDIGVRRFIFIDDIFNLNQANSARFFQLIIKNNWDLQLFFPNGLRTDLLTEGYIDLMVEAGTVNVGLALETASPRLQKLIGKNLDLEKFEKNVRYFCQKYPQVILELFIMHGFPTETEEEAQKTLNFLKQLKWIDFPYLHILKIYPNTDMERIAIENGISPQVIKNARGLAYHQLPDTLPFDKSFTRQYQSEFLYEYLLAKDRLLHVLPYQMKILTQSEMILKYNSYFPFEIRSFDDLLQFAGIHRHELDTTGFVDEEFAFVPGLNKKIANIFPGNTPAENAIRILLLDLSRLFSGEKNMPFDPSEAPLGLIYLLTYLREQFANKVKGKIAKSRIDFNNYAELKQLVEAFNPDIIGIRTLTLYKDFFHRTVSIIRQWKSSTPIILGGPYATSDYQTILKDVNVDIVVIGEGEITFGEIIGKVIDHGGKLPNEIILKDIPGIAFVPGREKPKKQVKHSETQQTAVPEVFHEKERQELIVQFNQALENE